MKYLPALIFGVLAGGVVNAQCTINPEAQEKAGANPPANLLPCIVQNVPYNQVIQGQVTVGFDTTLFGGITAQAFVDSVDMDSIAGLPLGISWSKNPNTLPGGGNGCVELTGTTTAAPGKYPISGFGTAWLTISIEEALNEPYTYNGNLAKIAPYKNYYVQVISDTGVCDTAATPTGIGYLISELNVVMSVFPNPSNGSFGIRLNAGKRLNGELAIIDVTGKKVYSQMLDILGLYVANVDLGGVAKGLYTLQLRTAGGYASKKISIE